MRERSKVKSFFLGEIDDYGIVLLGLFILTLYSPALVRSHIDYSIAPVTLTAYFVCYLLRYRRKLTKNWWDQFKLALTLLVLFTHIEKHFVGQFGDEPIFIINVAWLFTYYIDRSVFRTYGKFTRLVTGVLMLTCTFFVVFAHLQSNEHVKQRSLSEAIKTDADKHRKIAELESAKALETEAHVRQLETDLKNCQQTQP
jgi:hypothetical protein